MKLKRSSLFSAASFAFGTALLLTHSALGQTSSGWNGGTSSDFQTPANWDSGIAASYNLFVGQAWHNAGRTGSTTLDNASAYAGYRLNFENISGGANQTFTLQGSAITLFDFGINSPAAINSSSINQNINLPLEFNSGGVGVSLIQANGASGGNLSFGNTISLDGNGVQANQLRISGANANTVTFGGVISNTAGQTGGLNSVVPSQGSSNITVVFNAANSYDGDTFIDSGTLQFGTATSSAGSSNNSILRLGQNIANSPAASINLATTVGGVNVGSTLVIRPSLSGTQGTRTLRSSNTSGTNTYSGGVFLDADLTTQSSMGGTFAFTNSAFDLKNQTLRADGAGTTAISSILSNSTGAGKLTQTGSGTLSLSGASTFTGAITIGSNNAMGGTLLLDYATNATVLAATNAIAFGGGGTGGGGTLYIKGNSSGATAQTLGSLTVAQSSGQSTLIVDNNGGSGTTLTLGNTWTRGSGGTLLFDVSSGGSVTSSPTLQNGVVASASTLAPYFIKTATATDFITVSSGSLAALGATTQLGTSGGTTSEHRILSNTGTHALLGATTADTLRVDTTAGNGGILDLGANNLTVNKQNIIFDGTGTYTINGTTGSIANAFYSQFSTGTVTINSRVTGAVTKLGSGLLVGNVGNTSPIAGLNIFGGVYRPTNTNSLATTGSTNLNTGGILELTASMTTKSISQTAGVDRVNFQGSGGFSAFGGDRTVTFTNAGALTWASTTGFLADGGKLILGSDFSGHTLDLTNAISLNGSQRVVEVNEGTSTTNVDGLLSGIISGAGANSGLTKTGTGTLALTNANTYAGGTLVTAGTLLVNNTTGSGTGTRAVIVSSGASLGGSGTISSTATLANGAKLAFNLSTDGASHDALDLGGLVNSGTTTVVISSSGGASPGTYVLATASGGVSGAGSINPTPVLPGGWLGTVAVVGNNVELNLSSTGGGSTPYDTWAAGTFANPFTNTAPEVDFDNDGLENLMEFVLGGDPTISQAGIAPTVSAAGTDLVIIFKRSDASELQPVAVKVQVSADLATWNPASDIPIGPASSVGTIGAENATYTLTNSGGFDTVTVTIPKAAATKKFARVVATQ